LRTGKESSRSTKCRKFLNYMSDCYVQYYWVLGSCSLSDILKTGTRCFGGWICSRLQVEGYLLNLVRYEELIPMTGLFPSELHNVTWVSIARQQLAKRLTV
jgi:hypothetical protein